MVRSLATLATMLAAMIEAQILSPRTTAICGSGVSGTSNASISRYSGLTLSPATAPAWARMRARYRPRRSTCVWSITLVGGHELRVVQARDAVADLQHHRSTDDGSGQRTHPDLVDPGDDVVAH